jgi:hypothetical protein
MTAHWDHFNTMVNIPHTQGGGGVTTHGDHFEQKGEHHQTQGEALPHAAIIRKREPFERKGDTTTQGDHFNSMGNII